MSSRKEQKEKLRIEREKREAEAKAAERRKQLIGYGVGGALALVAVIVVAVLLLSGADSSEGGQISGDSDVLPEGGSVPEQRITDLPVAAKEAGCELQSAKATSRDHTGDPSERINYGTDPPSSGRHFQNPAPDGAFDEEVPDVKALVHTLEHGRVIVWFRPNLPRDQRANLRSLFEEDEYQMVLVPGPARAKYAVAASAWNADPAPLGTGRALTCPRVTPAAYDALRAFRDEHRGNGPEPVP